MFNPKFSINVIEPSIGQTFKPYLKIELEGKDNVLLGGLLSQYAGLPNFFDAFVDDVVDFIKNKDKASVTPRFSIVDDDDELGEVFDIYCTEYLVNIVYRPSDSKFILIEQTTDHIGPELHSEEKIIRIFKWWRNVKNGW